MEKLRMELEQRAHEKSRADRFPTNPRIRGIGPGDEPGVPAGHLPEFLKKLNSQDSCVGGAE